MTTHLPTHTTLAVPPSEDFPPSDTLLPLTDGLKLLIALKWILYGIGFWTNGPQSYWGWQDLLIATQAFLGYRLRANPLFLDGVWLIFAVISQLIEWAVIKNLLWFAQSWKNMMVAVLLTAPLIIIVGIDVADSATGWYGLLIQLDFRNINTLWAIISLAESLTGDVGTIIAGYVINYIVLDQRTPKPAIQPTSDEENKENKE